MGLPYTLLTVAGLLVVIGLLQPLAARLNLSPTVLLAAVGVCIGSAAGFLLQTDLTNAFNDIAELVLNFPISSVEVLYIFLPILLFFAMAFEHSVVNMFLFPVGIMLGADFTWIDYFLWNEIPTVLGNLVGGLLFTGLAIYVTHYRTAQRDGVSESEISVGTSPVPGG